MEELQGAEVKIMARIEQVLCEALSEGRSL